MAAEATTADVSGPSSPPQSSLAAPFFCPPASRLRGRSGQGGGRTKRPPAKSPAAKSAAPLRKKKMTVTAAPDVAAAADSSCERVRSAQAATLPELAPEAVAAWDLVRGTV